MIKKIFLILTREINVSLILSNAQSIQNHNLENIFSFHQIHTKLKQKERKGFSTSNQICRNILDCLGQIKIFYFGFG